MQVFTDIYRMNCVNILQKHHPKEAHWYLQVIGTEPTHQAQGIGSAVLRPVLRICDQEEILAYLETSNESNIPFYEGRRFFVTKELEKRGDVHKFSLMLREPVQNL